MEEEAVAWLKLVLAQHFAMAMFLDYLCEIVANLRGQSNIRQEAARNLSHDVRSCKLDSWNLRGTFFDRPVSSDESLSKGRRRPWLSCALLTIGDISRQCTCPLKITEGNRIEESGEVIYAGHVVGREGE